MNEKLNEPTIEEIKEALAKITPGEWGCGGGRYLPIVAICKNRYTQIGRAEGCADRLSNEEIEANGRLMAESPRYIRFLLATVEALESWIKAANQFAWVHDSFCPRRKANAACTCGLDGFLSRPRLFVDSYKQRVEALEKALSDLMAWGVEHDNPGIGYITVQVDRAAVEQARVLLKGKP